MEWKDLEPQTEKPKPKNLEEMSIVALGQYIDELRAEIVRTETMIKSKESARDGAQSVFRAKPE